MSKGRTITLQKTVYLSGQYRDEGCCVQPCSNILEPVYQDVISEKPIKKGYNFKKQKWEFFPELKADEGVKTCRYQHHGWTGLRKMLPYIDGDSNIECLVTVEFNSKDVSGWDDICQVDEYERLDDLYHFHSEADFWVVSEDYGYKMLVKGENTLNWEIDDGNLKWDCDRDNGDLIDNEDPWYELFPDSDSDRGIGIPFKVRVIVDADI